MTVDQDQRRQLRRELRSRRRALSPLARKRAALALTRQLLRHPQIQRSRHVALYLPNDGEIDPRVFVDVARRLGKTCYLPVLHPVYQNRLWFRRFDAGIALRPNRFGIPEPAARNAPRREPWALDVVLLPLVGFDAQGGRLGMGGGFYDRTFAYKRRKKGSRPFLIGLAHECQRVAALPIAPWDVPLDSVVSDGGIYGSREAERPTAGDREPVRNGVFTGRYRQKWERKGGRLSFVAQGRRTP